MQCPNDDDDPLAIAAVTAVRTGDVKALTRLLREQPGLAIARVQDKSRTLLHVVTDWPGNFPNSAAIVTALIAAGADVNACFIGAHTETALHWAASCDDVDALDALLDGGADIEAPGSVIGGGTALADAVAFGQWLAAKRLVERGAQTTLWQAAALGLQDRVEGHFADNTSTLAKWSPRPSKPGDTPPDEITHAFWSACHGGQRVTAEFLLDRGADLNWIGYDGLTPLDAARRSEAREVADWLQTRGAKTAQELSQGS